MASRAQCGRDRRAVSHALLRDRGTQNVREEPCRRRVLRPATAAIPSKLAHAIAPPPPARPTTMHPHALGFTRANVLAFGFSTRIGTSLPSKDRQSPDGMKLAQ